MLGRKVMKKVLLALAVCALPLSGWSQLFEPGNLIFADPFYTPDGQIVEMHVNDDDTATIINAVRWELDGANRRRALGLDVDPAGNVWVGITWTGDADSDFPEGIGQALRIEKDGTQTTWDLDIIKATLTAAIGVNDVIINSNAGDANVAQRVQVDANGNATFTDFNKVGYGEALRLPDGRIAMGDNGDSGIILYNETGGDPIGKLYDDGRTVRSLTYNPEIGSIVASLQDQHTLLRISLDGQLEEEFDTTADGFVNLWGIAQIPGTTNIILASHDAAAAYNEIGIYNALDLQEFPRVIAITGGFENAGLPADHVFRSFFNLAVVPAATSGGSKVNGWSLY
jgi:hypothetical protein